MKKFWLLSVLCTAIAVNANAQMFISNGGFDTVYTASNGSLQPIDWFVMGNNGGEATTDSHTGPYAVRIYNFNGNVAGILIYGEDNPSQTPGLPILINPLSVKGFYKYELGANDDDNDSARALVRLTRFDQLNGNTDTVGSGSMFFSPAAEYTAFTIPISYGADTLPADTLAIRFESSLGCNCTDSSGTCCFFYVDELSLELPSGLVSLMPGETVELVYNSQANQLSLSTLATQPWSVRLVDVTGRDVIFRERINANAVSLEAKLPTGVYMYRAFVNGKTVTGKLAVR